MTNHDIHLKQRAPVSIDASYISGQVTSNKDTILKFLGYAGREAPLPILQKIDKIILSIESLLDIQYEYKTFHDYAFAIYTVGELIEEEIRSYLTKKEMMNALILDKAAIVALDAIKDAIIENIEYDTQKFVSDEVYPASKNFPIENQRVIFYSFNNIDKITINPFYQLSPIKSVGVKFSLATRKKKFNRCKDCENPCENKQASRRSNRCL